MTFSKFPSYCIKFTSNVFFQIMWLSTVILNPSSKSSYSWILSSTAKIESAWGSWGTQYLRSSVLPSPICNFRNLNFSPGSTMLSCGNGEGCVLGIRRSRLHRSFLVSTHMPSLPWSLNSYFPRYSQLNFGVPFRNSAQLTQSESSFLDVPWSCWSS